MDAKAVEQDFVIGQDAAFTSRGGRRMVGELREVSSRFAFVDIETINGELWPPGLSYHVRREKLEEPGEDE